MEKKEVKTADEYRGVEIDKADNNVVTAQGVAEETKTLNNNPRNHDK